MMLFWHLPHEVQRVEQVAAPQQEAATDMTCGALVSQGARDGDEDLPCSRWALPAAGERGEHPWCVVVVVAVVVDRWRALSA
jgi:hypothetical protein